MKTLLTCLLLLIFAVSSAQNYPFIGQPTITPMPVSQNQPVRVITHVVTPNLGKSLSKTWSADSQNKILKIELCKWSGMLTAVQEYRDTFDIPPLAPGNWSLVISFTISSSDVACQSYTSNTATYTLQVDPVTVDVAQHERNAFSLYPNPCQEKLFVEGMREVAAVSVFALHGELVLNAVLFPGGWVDVSGLPAGIYFIALNSGEVSIHRKIVKN